MSKPECTIPSPGASPGEALYCAYNMGGDPATAGLNYQGLHCPVWGDLPLNVQEKWQAVAELAATASSVSYVGTFGWAIKMAKLDYRVQRKGWNGKGMFVAYTPGSGSAPGIVINPHLSLRMVDGSIMVGWTPNQMDMLAEDWQIV
jgi:hypothetical protein